MIAMDPRSSGHVSRGWRICVVLGVAVAAALAGAMAPAPARANQAANQVDYRLGAGDRVRINVFGEPDLTSEYELDGRGAFSMPLIGTVGAADRTVRELELEIDLALRDGYLVDPQVSVEVLNYRPFYILGEVKSPGSYPYRAGITVISAVALAGGYTFRADEDDIEISRGGANTDPADADQQTIILPGDIVRVKERFW